MNFFTVFGTTHRFIQDPSADARDDRKKTLPCHPERSGEGKAKAAQSNGSQKEILRIASLSQDDRKKKPSKILHSTFYIFNSKSAPSFERGKEQII